VIYVSLGDTDQAMDWLEKGYEERFNPGVLMRPGFDPLRSDKRFQIAAATNRPPVTSFESRTHVEMFCTSRFAVAGGKALCAIKLLTLMD